MDNIGLRLFQQLKGIDATSSKDDYFNDQEHKWDVDALEQDLKIAQDRMHQNNQNGNIMLTQQQPMQAAGVQQSADIHHNMPSIPTLSSSPIPMTTSLSLADMPSLISEHAISPSSDPLITHTTDAAANAVTPNASNDTTETHNLPVITEQTNNDDDDDNEDMDLAKDSNPSTHTGSQQMPSPNASPSIDFDGTSNGQNNVLSANANHGNVHNKKRGKKRKSVEPPMNGSSVQSKTTKTKKRRTNGVSHGNGSWNDAALKKLYSLKRQVKNSAWFWEPVDEVQHSAPNYHLVCPLPSDYGTICRKLEMRGYRDLDSLLRDCELVFINARMYNAEVHNVHRASLILEKKFKELMHSFVMMHYKMYGSERTLECWKKGKEYKPFAVPLDD